MAYATTRRSFAKSLAALPCAGCSYFAKSYTFNFKVTLEAIVDGVRHEGATVIRSLWLDNLTAFDTRRWSSKAYGDAILLDLGGSKRLLAILGGMQKQSAEFHISERLFLSYIPRPSTKDGGRELFERMGALSGDMPIPRRDWPSILYFSDINDLKSAEVAWPVPQAEAPEVEIIRFTLRNTNEREASLLPKQLPWFHSLETFPRNFGMSADKWPVYVQLDRRNVHVDGSSL